MSRTLVHLMRHGEVHNPDSILYGRLPGYRLSELGNQMAQQAAEWFADRGADLATIVASPLQRAQETATPAANLYDLPLHTDDRVIEAGSYLQGLPVSTNPLLLAHPKRWKLFRNPWLPTWGEPYLEQVARMEAAIRDAKATAAGREALIVSHQSPIYMTRLWLEGRSFLHDPRKRQCRLASVTTLTFDGDTLVGLDYAEPCADLLERAVAIT